jgi:hypothetical protein
MQHFITKSNFIRIAKKYSPVLDNNNNNVYTINIPFLSEVERKGILTIKQFLINSKDNLIEFTANGHIKDTYSFVNEEARYAKYHSSSNCKGLHSIYRDVEIPVEIKFKNGSKEIDKESVESFRKWFKQEDITNLYNTNQNKFIEKLQLKFNLKNPPRPVEIGNGEFHEVTNMSLNEITIQIENILNGVDKFYNKSEEYKNVLVNHGFSTKTFLVTSKKYRDVPINNNFTGLSDMEVRIILTEFYNKVKKPILDLLTNYWILKLNSLLDFNKNLLEQLKFQPCKLCIHERPQYIEDVDICDEDEDDDILMNFFHNSNHNHNTTNKLVLDSLPF